MRFNKISKYILGILFIWLVTLGPINPYIRAISNRRSPQFILVLGGDIDREVIGLRLAKELNLPIIISGGSNKEHAEWLIEKEGVKNNLVRLDYKAIDTLSNFSSTINYLQSNKINHVIAITSDDHFERANVLGNIIFGSKGIKLTGISIKCNSDCQIESKRKKLLDYLRAILWVLTNGNDPKIFILEKLKLLKV